MDTEENIFQGYNETNALKNALSQFDKAAQLLNITGNQLSMIKEPRRACQANLPVRMDNGRIEMFQAFRVQHNVARGPAKGLTFTHT